MLVAGAAGEFISLIAPYVQAAITDELITAHSDDFQKTKSLRAMLSLFVHRRFFILRLRSTTLIPVPSCRTDDGREISVIYPARNG